MSKKNKHKESEVQWSMALYSCEEHDQKKCRTPCPCQLYMPYVPGITKPPRNCPLGKKSKFAKVPTMELTV